MKANADLVRSGLEALGIMAERLHGGLVRYIEEIELWNPSYGLVNSAGDELVIKHILDSLAPIALLESLLAELDARGAPRENGGACLADIGTGAGLPGIPLSLALPGRRVVLVERMGKRVRFLENQKALLGLDNVTILESEAERAKGPFDLVVFRAFRPFTETKLFSSIAKHVSRGGIMAAYKGKEATARAELASLAQDPVLGSLAAGAELIPLKVPFLDEERCLVVMRAG